MAASLRATTTRLEEPREKLSLSNLSESNNDDYTNISSQDDDLDWKSRVQFFVLGIQKGGTTSLFKYMGQHPRIQRPRNKETHCFQSHFYNASDPYCARYFQFHPQRLDQLVDNNKNGDDYITGDFSPGYLWKGISVILRIQATYPYAKFIVSLRNPVDRAFSQYRMQQRNYQNKSQNATTANPSFEYLCLQELEIMRKVGLLQHWNFPDATKMNTMSVESHLDDIVDMYRQATVNSTHLKESFFGSADMMLAWKQLLQIKTPSRGMVQKGLYALELLPWLDAFDRHPFLVLSLEKMAHSPQAQMKRIHHHLGLPHVPVRDLEPVNTAAIHEQKHPVSTLTTTIEPEERMQQILAKLYRPFDDMLQVVLEDDQWQDPWNYAD